MVTTKQDSPVEPVQPAPTDTAAPASPVKKGDSIGTKPV